MHLRSHRCRRGCELSRGQYPNNGSITGTEHILGVHKQPSFNGLLLNNHVLWTYLVQYGTFLLILTKFRLGFSVQLYRDERRDAGWAEG